MFLRTLVIDWLTKRDSKGRVTRLDTQRSGGRTYLLNGNRIENPQTEGAYTVLSFYDVLGNTKESPSILTVTASKANVLQAMNNEFTSSYFTIPVFKDNDYTKATSDIYIPSKSISYVDTYRVNNSYSWVIYYQHDFKRVEVLSSLSMDELFVLGGGVVPSASITWDSIIEELSSNLITFDAA